MRHLILPCMYFALYLLSLTNTLSNLRDLPLTSQNDRSRRWSSFPSVRVCRKWPVLEADLTIANRSANATVELGLALSTSSPTLDPSSSSPFFRIVTARILTTPHPDASITLATHLNALGGLGNRSFNKIVCVSPETAGQKRIEIWPRGCPSINGIQTTCVTLGTS